MNHFWLTLWLATIILAGCTTGAVDEPELPSQLPAPTVHPFFAQAEPTPTSLSTATEVASPALTGLPQTTPEVSRLQTMTTTVYGDVLHANWQLLDSKGMEVDLSSTVQVHDGRFAVAMTPTEDFSTLYFAVGEEATERYPQDQVLSLTFWLNSGNDFLELEDLSVAVVGSNDYPYWAAGDESAYIDGEYPFSETRLYFLGLNRSIPPETWVQVDLWLDNLIYDPEYNYVTGFYIKNDEGFFNTVYVDDINLTMAVSETTP